MTLTYFPVSKNKYSALQVDDGDRPSEGQVALSGLGLPEESATRPIAVSRPKPIKKKPNLETRFTPVNVHIYGDSQGRGVSKELADDSNHRISSMITREPSFKTSHLHLRA